MTHNEASTPTDDFEALPEVYLTSDLPGVGGSIKNRPEDFLVEEIPLYEPCGEGEHVYLFIEKRGRATLDVVDDLARAFRVRPRDVGYAGMKDKHAVTRQLISIHTFDDSPVPTLNIPGVTIVWADRHRNKLRLGHLRGNRFVIRIRDVQAVDAVKAARVLERLERHGAPNFVGEQRFGHRMDNHRIGRAYLLEDYRLMCDRLLGAPTDPSQADHEARLAYERGDFNAALQLWPRSRNVEHTVARRLAAGDSPERAVRAVREPMRRFFVTAFQSAVFNDVLARRLRDQTFDRLLDGDLAYKHDNGAVFAVGPPELADPDVQQRLADLKISPSGPLWGSEMTQARGVVGEVERSALERTGVDVEAFSTPPHDVHGARRSLRMPVADPQIEGGVDEHGPYILVRFTLPAGGFATTVLRELMKHPAPSFTAATSARLAAGDDDE